MDEVSPSTNQAEEASSSSSFSLTRLPWRPSQLVFHPYASPVEKADEPQSLRVAGRNSIVERLTKDIIETYRLCNPLFQYSDELNLKRFLTSPSTGVLNDGYDNANSDLILSVNFVLFNSDKQRRYIVKDMLGQGTFGQVAKCWITETSSFVAVKVIKNQPAYYQQALVEVAILANLNKKHDPEDKHHIVRIYDYFVYQRHLCIVFELLDTNLYEIIKMNKFRGVTLRIVQLFSKQILCGLALMKDAGIIHCDLKPENILLCPGGNTPNIKIIDFGSACMEDRTVYSYIQSRYYRSPEVLLGYQYNTVIDMWSFGCIVAELFLGLPLFPGASEFDLLRRMIQILGGQPPDYVLKETSNTSKFFKYIGSIHYEDDGAFSIRGRSAYQALTEKEYEAREQKKPSIGKEYFSYKNLEEIVTSYPYQKNLPREDIVIEKEKRLALIDFLKGLLEFDPAKRWSPMQASKHPFLTGEAFTCPYRPPPETPRMPVSQRSKVDHHPGQGHWFNAGLSPNINVTSQVGLHNIPQFQAVPYAHANSYGSIGSYGSYNDGFGMGSSYGSYGDRVNTFVYCSPAGPSALNVRTQGRVAFLGSSPDARRASSQFPYGGGLGVSPSAGSFTQLAHTTSSSHTPPGSYSQIPAGSPGLDGPTSPARGNNHGSPLGKTAAANQFNRRKSWGYPGSLQSQDQHSRVHFIDGSFSSLPDGNSLVHSISYTSNRKQYPKESGLAGRYPAIQKTLGSSIHGSSMQFSLTSAAAQEKPEASLAQPDPTDWFPNYSEEHLLQEDGLDANVLAINFNQRMHVGQASTSTEQFGGVERFNWAVNPSADLSGKRSNGTLQAYSHVNVGSPPDAGYPRSKPSHFLPHSSPNFPSRLGQHSVQRFNHGNSTANRASERNNSLMPLMSGVNSAGQYSSSNGQLNNGTPWGRRGNNPITQIPPTRGRKDYGRIS